jgi:hypothetical protein
MTDAINWESYYDRKEFACMAEAIGFFYKNGYVEDEQYAIPGQYRVMVKGAEVVQISKVGFLQVIAEPKLC